MIRPERVRLEPHGAAGENRVPGMVEEVVYLGFHQEVRVRLATGALVAATSPTTARPVEYARATRSPCTCPPTACACWMPRRRRAARPPRGAVIRRDGFAGATVGEITREAGASLGLLNYHFGVQGRRRGRGVRRGRARGLRRARGDLAPPRGPAARLAAYLDRRSGRTATAGDVGRRLGRGGAHRGLRATLERLRRRLARGARRRAGGRRRAGRWACADPEDTAARLVAVARRHRRCTRRCIPAIACRRGAPRRGRAGSPSSSSGVDAARTPPPSPVPAAAARRTRSRIAIRGARPRRPRPASTPRCCVALPGGGPRGLARRRGSSTRRRSAVTVELPAAARRARRVRPRAPRRAAARARRESVAAARRRGGEPASRDARRPTP